MKDRRTTTLIHTSGLLLSPSLIWVPMEESFNPWHPKQGKEKDLLMQIFSRGGSGAASRAVEQWGRVNSNPPTITC